MAKTWNRSRAERRLPANRLAAAQGFQQAALFGEAVDRVPDLRVAGHEEIELVFRSAARFMFAPDFRKDPLCIQYSPRRIVGFGNEAVKAQPAVELVRRDAARRNAATAGVKS
jgi:hypothetical protein